MKLQLTISFVGFAEDFKKYSKASGLRSQMKPNFAKAIEEWPSNYENLLIFSMYAVLKGTISDRKFQTSLFPEPPDFFAYSGRNSL